MSNRQGFTLIEVLVAVTVLGIGILGLVGSSALVTRMVGRGRHTTMAVQVAQERMETLRQLALSTATPCSDAGLTAGTRTATTRGLAESWTVTGAGTGIGTSRTLAARVTFNAAGGQKSVTLNTIIRCE
jgi:prepilin-type N-terminal cleavage/methylation domain-containing protein